MTAKQTLRELTGMDNTPARVSNSALVLIDCQNTYRRGVMQLEGVEEALDECRGLLDRYRAAGRPVIHIQHNAGPGSPFDIHDDIGAIASAVAPAPGEAVVVKQYPSSFEGTNLDELLKARGVKDLTIAGFMTHVCVNSTARAAFNRGYRATVVGDATATRSLATPAGEELPARVLQEASLTALSDIFAVVVRRGEEVTP